MLQCLKLEGLPRQNGVVYEGDQVGGGEQQLGQHGGVADIACRAGRVRGRGRVLATRTSNKPSQRLREVLQSIVKSSRTFAYPSFEALQNRVLDTGHLTAGRSTTSTRTPSQTPAAGWSAPRPCSWPRPRTPRSSSLERFNNVIKSSNTSGVRICSASQPPPRRPPGPGRCPPASPRPA